MSDKLICIATDFSPFPAGRYSRDGDYSGEVFRNNFLLPALTKYERVVVDLDGTDGMGSSFLEEAFGGLVRNGYSEKILRARLVIKSSRKTYPIKIWSYIGNQ